MPAMGGFTRMVWKEGRADKSGQEIECRRVAGRDRGFRVRWRGTIS
jgi:hypothetical protein